jgi:hypothetical protein
MIVRLIVFDGVRLPYDRAGVKRSMEVDVTVKPPFETILDAIEGGSRSEWRRSRGLAERQ